MVLWGRTWCNAAKHSHAAGLWGNRANKAELPAPDNHHKATQTSSTFIWMTATWNSALNILHEHKQSKNLLNSHFIRFCGSALMTQELVDYWSRWSEEILQVSWRPLRLLIVWFWEKSIVLRAIHLNVCLCCFLFTFWKTSFMMNLPLKNALILLYNKWQKNVECESQLKSLGIIIEFEIMS